MNEWKTSNDDGQQSVLGEYTVQYVCISISCTWHGLGEYCVQSICTSMIVSAAHDMTWIIITITTWVSLLEYHYFESSYEH